MNNQTNNPVAKAVHWILFAGAAAAVAAPSMSFAAEGEEEVERIEVTGSRIKRTDIEGANPVLSISRADIEAAGVTDLGTLLQQVPAAGAAINRTFNNGGDGAIRVDLRNMGTSRTLVLVNGRRWINSGTGADASVDLNTIPLNIVERVEVLKDGASSVYGSDAIAGVVNIITRKDFEGVQISAQTGQYEHGDGESHQIDLLIGSTSEKGNVTFGLNWNEDKPVWAGDRVFSRSSANPAQHSSGTPQGRFFGLGAYGVPGGSQTLIDGRAGTSAADYRRFVSPADRYNFNPDNYILTPSERRGAFASSSYQLSDSIQVFAEASYQNRRSNQTLAPEPLFLGAAFGDATVIHQDNPFNWTDTPFGDDCGPTDPTCVGPDGLANNDPNDPVNDDNFDNLEGIGRRMVESGRRNFGQNIDTYRFATGLNGEFSNGWSWDANYVYGDNRATVTTDGVLNETRLRKALGDPTLCVKADDGCVPLNVFGGQGVDGRGSITREMLDYITFTGHDSGGNTTEELSANLTGDLFDLPAGPLGFAVGVADREEEGFDSPDALIASGQTTGNSRLPTSGGYNVKEVYAEFIVPLLSDLPLVDSLELSVASRYSDYNNFGSTTNSKAGVTWRLNSEFMVRGTWSEGFRAPSISELFGGAGDNFPELSDPCSTTFNPDGVAASCAAAGVPVGFAQPNSQIRTTVGSNPDLGPETSESITAGFVYSPSWYEGSSITVDWYEVELDGVITSLGAQNILNNCYRKTPATDCNLITRSATGFITDLQDTQQNLATREISGVDINLASAKHETAIGSFRFNLDTAYVDYLDDFNPTLVEASNPHGKDPSAGLLFGGGRDNNPRWRANTALNWEYGDWSASWSTQYMHHVRVDKDEASDAGTELSSAFYNDIQMSYHLADLKTRVTLGVDNFLDKDPPFTTSAFANGFDPSYRMPGPFGYVRVTASF
ncbi:MAG: TonB-dependent receptor [Gammaproteobacteria bacterium]|nr:TonB-dependent receptor [Gammaproteobacteria bacterium]